MKKLAIISIFAAMISIATAASSVGKTFQMVYYGDWESTIAYAPKKIFGSSTAYTAPVVTDGSGLFLSESAIPAGTHPASAPTAWKKIN